MTTKTLNFHSFSVETLSTEPAVNQVHWSLFQHCNNVKYASAPINISEPAFIHAILTPTDVTMCQT